LFTGLFHPYQLHRFDGTDDNERNMERMTGKMNPLPPGEIQHAGPLFMKCM